MKGFVQRGVCEFFWPTYKNEAAHWVYCSSFLAVGQKKGIFQSYLSHDICTQARQQEALNLWHHFSPVEESML